MRKRATFLVATVLTAALAHPARAQSWEAARSLGSSSNGLGYFVAASGSLVHAIVDADPLTYRRSTDQGATWSSGAVLGGRVHLNDPIAAEGSNVWIVYLDNIWGATDMPCCPRDLGDLYLRRSFDGGLTWQPAQRLTTGAGAYRISMAVSGGRVHIAWMDYRTYSWDIRYLRSTDGGATWDAERVMEAGGNAGRPQVAALGDRVAIADGLPPPNARTCFAGAAYEMPCVEVYVQTSSDGGVTFASPVQVSPSLANPPTPEADHSSRPDIALVPPNAIVVAWDEPQNSTGWPTGFRTEQYARTSTDGGATWLPEVRLTDSPNSTHNAIAVSGSVVHLAWFDSRDGNEEIYYRSTLDSGLTWEPEARLTSTPTSSSTPSIAVSSGYVHVVWMEDYSRLDYRRRALPAACADGEVRTCYSGPGGTLGVGLCRGGTQSCVGGAWQQACAGEITPTTETCDGNDNDCDSSTDEDWPSLGAPCTAGRGACRAQGTYLCTSDGSSVACDAVAGAPRTEVCEGTVDEDCDGTVDNGCPCTNGQSRACYNGPTGTDGVGVCRAGTQTCASGVWSVCSGDITPVAETCDGDDNDCDGNTDEDSPTLGAACVAGIGACRRAGSYVCSGDGNAVQCNAVAGGPGTEVCDGSTDEDCDGAVDNGCPCSTGDSRSCYGGPAGTQGVGACAPGTQSCSSGTWGECAGEALPATEVCDDRVDNDCDARTDAADTEGCAAVPPADETPPGAMAAGCSCSDRPSILVDPGLLLAIVALWRRRRGNASSPI